MCDAVGRDDVSEEHTDCTFFYYVNKMILTDTKTLNFRYTCICIGVHKFCKIN